MIKNNKYQLEVTPLTNIKNVEFREFSISEKLGGELPICTLTLKYWNKNDIQASVDKVNIHIKTEGLNSYLINFSGIVTGIEFLADEVTYTIMVCTRDFITKPQIGLLSNSIDSAISSLVTISHNNQKSNVNDFSINRCRMTDYNLVKRLLRGYNKDIVYGFSIAGLVINKLNGDIDKNFSKLNISKSSKPRSLSDNKYKELLVEKTQLHNLVSLQYERYTCYSMEGSSIFMDNYYHNLNIASSDTDFTDAANFMEYVPVPIGLYIENKNELNISKLMIESKFTIFDDNITTELGLIENSYER